VPTPYHVAKTAPIPVGWQATFSRLDLQQDAPVLILPFPAGIDVVVESWQADTGQPGSLIGGYFLAPGPTGRASFYFTHPTPQTEVATYLFDIWKGKHPSPALSDAEIRAVIVRDWRTGAIVAVTNRQSAIAHLLIRLFGEPTYHIDSILSWRLPR
jgi:hypothetical protein